ncbi:hypothetical protein BGZ76_005089, partial [Entomortierella beljakovae]
MHSIPTPPTHKRDSDIPQNSNVDEYLRREGMTDEEWKRVYDLRYCTILVPFEEEEEEEEEEDSDQEETIEALHDKKKGKNTSNKNQGMHTPPRRQGQVQLATPKSSERHQDFSKVSTRREPNSPTLNIGLQTPTEKQATFKSFELNIRNNQEDDVFDMDTTRLRIDDPLASYLPTPPKFSFSTKSLSSGHASNLNTGNMNNDDMDMNPFINQGDQAEHDEPLRAGIKRRHWELEQTSSLLKPTQPESVKRVVLTTSFMGTSSTTNMGLLRPRSFSPSLSPALFQRRGSASSDISSINHDFSQSKLWTKQDWKALESIYNEMDGSSMVEEDLVQIANRFITEQEAITGEAPFWTREKVLMRCIALYRVRNDTHPSALDNNKKSNSLVHRSTSIFSSLRSTPRHSSQPYPSQKPKSSLGGGEVRLREDSTSSSAISDFLSSRRADRSQKQRSGEQGYQLKSVFKHRLASGLRTVGQLIPFWKDVEQGNTDVKGKEKVPLGVPLGAAQL